MMTLTSSEFMFSSSDAILNEFNNHQSQYYFLEFQQALISRSLGVEGREFFSVSPLLCKRCLMRSEKQIFLYYTMRIEFPVPVLLTHSPHGSRSIVLCHGVPSTFRHRELLCAAPPWASCTPVPQLGMAGTVTGTHRPGHQQPEHHKS